MGVYANWLKQADCKSVTEKDTLGVRIPPFPQNFGLVGAKSGLS